MSAKELAQVISDRGLKLSVGEAQLPESLRGKNKKDEEPNVFVSTYMNTEIAHQSLTNSKVRSADIGMTHFPGDFGRERAKSVLEFKGYAPKKSNIGIVHERRFEQVYPKKFEYLSNH
jgi:hypothetical protein